MFLGVAVAPLIQSSVIEKSNIPLSNGKTLYVGGSGEGNYSKIQNAIDNASDGDTVFVFNGIYRVRVSRYIGLVVNKSINLIGEDKKSTIIEKIESGEIIQVTGGDITISDFTIRGSGGLLKEHWGIVLRGYGDTNTIENNYIENVENGIFIDMSNYNNIRNNEITKCNSGIYLGCCSYNNIYQNNITNNNYDGIRINLYAMCHDCANNNIHLNNIMKNRVGISIQGSFHGSPRKNNISQNNIMYNRYGVVFDRFSYDNKIYHNNFINIIRNARDWNCSGNYWDDGSEGNYWDSYRGKDKDGNGIGDKPYWIPPYKIGNKDRYPLMEPYDDVPDVSIKSVNKVVRNRVSSFPFFYWFLERFPLLAKLLSLLR